MRMKVLILLKAVSREAMLFLSELYDDGVMNSMVYKQKRPFCSVDNLLDSNRPRMYEKYEDY